MRTYDFSKDAGSSIFDAEREAALVETSLSNHIAERLRSRAAAIGFGLETVRIEFEASNGRATVSGVVASQAEREKLILFLGNNQGVTLVEDALRVEGAPFDEGVSGSFYTVVKGDTLARLAKSHYGDPLMYARIFEANRPMLKNPDLIFPGQVLRLPPAEEGDPAV